jgi:6-phosphofructokinase 1
VANREKKLPPEYITADGFHITVACRRYLAPLVQGEAYPRFRNGLPDYVVLRNHPVPKKLARDFKI